MSVDPLAGKYAQLTPYNYAGNEPIGDKDIDGMQSENTQPSGQSAGNSTKGVSLPKPDFSKLLHGYKLGHEYSKILDFVLRKFSTI